LNRWERETLDFQLLIQTTIQEIIQSIGKFEFVSTIDLNMGYYSIPLDEDSKKLCATILPFGIYLYNFSPMGIAVATDVLQRVMTDMFHNKAYF